jgi:hypothetical protein
VLFRKHTVLPLDDCFYALRAAIKFSFAQLYPTANVKTAVNFATALIEAVPYRTYTLSLTEQRSGPSARYRLHMFDSVYDTHRQIEEHLAAFLDACNFAKRLKTLTWPDTLRSDL